MLIGVIAEETLMPLAARPSALFVDEDGLPNWFNLDYRPNIFQVGFVSPQLFEETDILLADEKIIPAYITDGYQGIFPDRIDDSEVFFDFSHSDVPILSPRLYLIDVDLIYKPTIPVIPPLQPLASYVDPDIFYSPALLATLSPALVIDDDVIRAQVIRRAGDAIVLLLETFIDTDAFFAPTTGRAVLPISVADADVIYAAGQGAYLLPGTFNSDDVFFAPIAFNQLGPSTVVDADTVFGPELRTPGRMELFVDDDIFFVPSVNFTALAPADVASDDAFFTHVIASNPAIWPFLPADDVDVDDTFYAPSVTHTLLALDPHFWPDVDDIKSVPSVVRGDPAPPSDQTITADLATDSDAFYAPVTVNKPPNSYTNWPGGVGNRSIQITITTTATAGAGGPEALVEGTQLDSWWWNSGQSGREIKFDFGVARNITEAKWYQSTSSTHGTWKWQGSSDGSSWTDIGSTFTLGGTSPQTQTELNGNVNSWRYYRLLQTAGSTSNSPFLREIEFQIDAISPTVTGVTWDSGTVANATLSGGNLVVTNTGTTSGDQGARVASASGKTSGKYYFEITLTTETGGANAGFGVATTASTYTNMGNNATSGVQVFLSGVIWTNGSNSGRSIPNPTSGHIIGIAVDLDNRKAWFRNWTPTTPGTADGWNGVTEVAPFTTQNPANNSGGETIPSGTIAPICTFGGSGGASGNVYTANFGTTSFRGAVPSGFTAGWV